MLDDRWSSPEWKKIYYRLYKRRRFGKLPEKTNLVKLTDKLYNELHPTDNKPIHPDLQLTYKDKEGREYYNWERELALYLRHLCKDEDRPQDFIDVNTEHPASQDASPRVLHPNVRLRRRKQVNELPSSDEW